MSLLREVKPRNARTARIVKAREPQLLEDRKRVLLLHGAKCPTPVRAVLKTVSTLTKPHSVLFTKKNPDIHPFDDPASLQFLAGKNECGIVVFGTHSKKRPNNITVMRIYDEKPLDMLELLMLTSTEEPEQENSQLQIGVEMKPMILFAGSQWDDESASEQATLFRTIKSTMLDLFQGEEIASIDVAGLQYLLMIAAGEFSTSADLSTTSSSNFVIHLRWYRLRTTRSDTPKIPRVELDPIGPSFDFRVGRFRLADPTMLKEALKHGRRPNEARTKKNIETDLVGDKLGRVHLGKQDLATLQTRKMKGLKRSRDDAEDDAAFDGEEPVVMDDDVVSQDEDGDIDLDGVDVLSEGGSSGGGSGDEISIGEDDDEEEEERDEEMDADEMPKRQRLA